MAFFETADVVDGVPLALVLAGVVLVADERGDAEASGIGSVLINHELALRPQLIIRVSLRSGLEYLKFYVGFDGRVDNLVGKGRDGPDDEGEIVLRRVREVGKAVVGREGDADPVGDVAIGACVRVFC